MGQRRLVVVPDSDRLEQWLVEASAGGFVDLRSACTLAQLLERCEPGRAEGLAPADPLLGRMLLGVEAPRLARRAFGEAATAVDFAAQAQELLGHLRAQGATPQQLAAAAVRAPESLAARARALAELWLAEEEALARLRRFDRGDAWRLAAEALRRDGLPPPLQGLSALEVRLVHDVPPARLRFLEALAIACQRARVAFTWRWPASGHAATDAFLSSAVREVEARWQALDAEVLADVPLAPLAWVGAAAFADAPAPRPAPELFAFAAPSAREEIREIARRARELVEAGVPPEAVGVAFRDLAADSEALVEALAEQGLAARARLGVPLAQSPLGRLALHLLELPDEGFPADKVAGVLESRAVALLDAEAAPARRTFREAGVRDDVLGATEAGGAFAVRLAALARRSAQRRKVELLASAVAALLSACRAVPEQGEALELLEAWWELLSRLELLAAPRRAASEGDGLYAQEVDRALARDQAAVEALARLLSSLKAALVESGLGRRSLSRRAFARWVRRAMADVNLVARGPRAGAVVLLDARELAGRRFAHLFLGGLVDGRFPGRATPWPLLTEDERGELNRAAGAPLFRTVVGEGEVRLPVALAEDRLLLHLALCAGASVTVSRARRDDGGAELLASPFRDALTRCVDGLREVQVARAAVPTVDEVRTEGELRARLALEALSPEVTRQSAADARRVGVAAVLGAEAWFHEARHLGGLEAERLRFFGAAEPVAGPASGRVEGDVLAALQPRLSFDAAHPVAAAELGRWGECAFKGLAQYVLGFSEVEEAGEDLDGRAAGIFWHDALSRVVPTLAEAGALGRDSPRALELVRDAVGEAARELEGRVAVGHPVLWKLGQRRAEALVHRLVRSPMVTPFGAAAPRHVEAPFGEASALEPLREVALPAALPGEEDVYLRGRIDRVDSDGERFAVVDYKSSLPRTLGDDFLRREFQMAFYLLAVAKLSPGRAPQAAWLNVKTHEVKHLGKALEKVATVDEVLATDAPTRERLAQERRPNLGNAVHGLLGRLRRGDFGARPLDCRKCELKGLCRISQRRLLEESP